MGIFGTAGIRGSSEGKVNLEFCSRFGKAFASYFISIGKKKTIVACDGRTSSEALRDSMSSSLLYEGMDIIDIGKVPSPLLAFASFKYNAPGVMITASHNPPMDNGIKIFSSGFEVGLDTEKKIEDLFINSYSRKYRWEKCGSRQVIDIENYYLDNLLAFLNKMFEKPDLDGMDILVDSGNGVGSSVITKALNLLGANVNIVNSHVSGLFPGRPSEPSFKNLEGSLKYAERTCPDIIIAQDGDADRVNVISSEFELIPEDTLLAFFADLYSQPGDRVVLSIDTSLAIDEFLKGKGVEVIRVPLGYLHDGISNYDPSFAGEPWKHIHLPFGPWIDGIASSVLLSIFLKNSSFKDLFSSIPKYYQEKRNILLEEDADVDKIIKLLKNILSQRDDADEVICISGIRVNFNDNSWLLVRPSGTEPKLRVIVEGASLSRFNELMKIVVNILEE